MRNAERHHAACHYEYHYAECHYAERRDATVNVCQVRAKHYLVVECSIGYATASDPSP
jgi:hypothetical protein